MPPSPSSERYAYIDFLRGIAALMVVYLHTSEIFLSSGFEINSIERSVIVFFSKTVGIGEVGVCVFLMISGFVVPFSLFRFESNPIKNFVVHRFFRLYPAYWLSVPLGLLFVPWHGGQEASWSMALVNLSMLEDFVGIPEIMGQYWTLSLELLFYFSCVILFAMHRLNSFKAMLLVMLFFILFRELIGHLPLFNKGAFGKVTSFRYLDFMFFGLLYRKWLLNGDKMAGWQSIAVMAVAFLTFGAVADARTFMSGIYFDASGNFALKTQLTQLSAIAFFVFFTRFYRPSNVAGTFIGKISYSVYLFHPVIFYPLYSHWFQSSDLRVHPHIFIVAATTLTIVAAYLTYQLIERPCVDIGRRLSARLFVENSGLNEPTERFGRVTRSAPRKTA